VQTFGVECKVWPCKTRLILGLSSYAGCVCDVGMKILCASFDTHTTLPLGLYRVTMCESPPPALLAEKSVPITTACTILLSVEFYSTITATTHVL